jgi:hypothetical protein
VLSQTIQKNNMPEPNAEKRENVNTVILYHELGKQVKDLEEIKRNGLKPSAQLYREGRTSYKWPGNKGQYIFLHDKLQGNRPTAVVQIPSGRVIVANELMHVNNPQQWESSFMSYAQYQEQSDKLTNFQAEFLVLGQISPENIVKILNV